MALTPEKQSEIAAYLRADPKAQELGRLWEDLVSDLCDRFDIPSQEDYTRSEADEALYAYTFWHTWGN